METSVEKIKKLRNSTSLGIKECKKALEDSGGNFDEAMQILKKRGIEVIEKKKHRLASQGLIDAYIHFGGNLGALVEVNCETDFVARTEVFKKFVKDLAMHIAAANPKYIKKEDVPADELTKLDNTVDYFKDNCLMEQAFIKDNKINIGNYLQDIVSQTGENIVIKRFSRFTLGEVNEG